MPAWQSLASTIILVARLMSFMASATYNFDFSRQRVLGIGCVATAYALDANGFGKVFGTNTFNMGTFTVTGGATQFWSDDRGDA